MEDNSQCLPHSFHYKSPFRPTILSDFFLLFSVYNFSERSQADYKSSLYSLECQRGKLNNLSTLRLFLLSRVRSLFPPSVISLLYIPFHYPLFLFLYPSFHSIFVLHLSQSIIPSNINFISFNLSSFPFSLNFSVFSLGTSPDQTHSILSLLSFRKGFGSIAEIHSIIPSSLLFSSSSKVFFLSFYLKTSFDSHVLDSSKYFCEVGVAFSGSEINALFTLIPIDF